MLARKAAGQDAPTFPVKVGWDGGVLTAFVVGRPTNPLNGGQRSYMKHARLRKEWREKTAHHLLPFLRGRGSFSWRADAPKIVTFTVYAFNMYDADALGAVCKSVRDALKDMGVIQDDRPSAGHTFHYTQAKPTRTAGVVHGIAIRIALKETDDV